MVNFTDVPSVTLILSGGLTGGFPCTPKLTARKVEPAPEQPASKDTTWQVQVSETTKLTGLPGMDTGTPLSVTSQKEYILISTGTPQPLGPDGNRVK